MINFTQTRRAIRGYETALLCRLLPDGKHEGCEYVVLNPTRHDTKQGSFKINLHTFKWSEFPPEISSVYGLMYEVSVALKKDFKMTITNTTKKATSNTILVGGIAHV